MIDSDCASLAHVCEANKCVPPGMPPLRDMGPVDMGPRDAAPTDAAPLDAGPSSVLSGVFTAQSDPSSYLVFASFTETPTGAVGPCTTREEGPCSITVCSATPSAPMPRSAGSLMVSGGTATVTIAANTDFTYTAATGAGPLFAGTALTFEGSGDAAGVPAFSGMVTPPSNATLNTPAIIDATPIVVSRTADLMLAWTPAGPTGTVEATFATADGTGVSASAICRFPVNLFMGTIPFTAFSDFPVGATGSYSFSLIAETELMPAGGWNVTLAARSPMLMPGGPAAGSATF